MYASYPLRFDDIYRALVRTNQVRIFLWVPLLTTYAVLLALITEQEPKAAALIALRVACVYFAVQPALIAASLSSSIAVTQNRWIIPLAPLVLALVVLAIVLPFIGESFLATVKLLLLLGAVAKCIQLLFRVCYRGRALDLISIRK